VGNVKSLPNTKKIIKPHHRSSPLRPTPSNTEPSVPRNLPSAVDASTFSIGLHCQRLFDRISGRGGFPRLLSSPSRPLSKWKHRQLSRCRLSQTVLRHRRQIKKTGRQPIIMVLGSGRRRARDQAARATEGIVAEEDEVQHPASRMPRHKQAKLPSMQPHRQALLSCHLSIQRLQHLIPRPPNPPQTPTQLTTAETPTPMFASFAPTPSATFL
jgi:hypothetical protein